VFCELEILNCAVSLTLMGVGRIFFQEGVYSGFFQEGNCSVVKLYFTNWKLGEIRLLKRRNIKFQNLGFWPPLADSHAYICSFSILYEQELKPDCG